MNYNRKQPEFMAKPAINYVNERFDITDEQSVRLKDYKERLNIPPSAIVRLALSCFLPKIRSDNFTEEGIKNLWNSNKF